MDGFLEGTQCQRNISQVVTSQAFFNTVFVLTTSIGNPLHESTIFSVNKFAQITTLQQILLDTTQETSEIGWTTYPEGGWDEVSVLDGQRRLLRTYEVCNSYAQLSNRSNWLRTGFIEGRGARRVYTKLRFSVRDCASLRPPPKRHHLSCKETFTLYYHQTQKLMEVEEWEWTEELWVKVDTIGPGKSFTRDPGKGGQGPRMDERILDFGPVNTNGFYLAFVDTGACLSLAGVKVYFHKCPATVRGLALFPETPSSGEGGASLAEAIGNCVPGAQQLGKTRLTLHCGGEGEWMVSSGNCICNPGREESEDGTECRACPRGTYHSPALPALHCRPCPSNSNTTTTGAQSCTCNKGFYRTPEDLPESPCTGPPSAPRDLNYEVTGPGAVSLTWRTPKDMGGRSEVIYSVACKECMTGRCLRCGDGVTFRPGQVGILQTKVHISGLLPGVAYTLEIQAVNQVSELSLEHPKYASLNLSISQSVPSAVPIIHQVSRSMQSITLSWPEPEQPNGKILDYQLRYREKADEGESLSLISETNTATVGGLNPGAIYSFQVRARTEAGYGPYGGSMYFQTVHGGEPRTDISQDRLPLIVGSCLGALAFVGISIILILILLFKSKRRETPYTDRLQHYISSRGLGVRYYIDPSTYEDAAEAVREFAREIDVSFVKIEEVIGTGEFGEVCRGRLCPPGKRELCVCIRTLRSGIGDKERREFLTEASILGQFDHPNVVRLEGAVTRSRPIMILTEHMENGALDAYLRQCEGGLSGLQIVSMLRGVASGMRYLSDRNYVHRRLAACRILVNGQLVCKVSGMRGPGEGGRQSLRWMSPEAHQQRKFSSASDVWSYGIVMWEVTSYGERPYWDMGNQEVLDALEQEYRLPPPPDCPSVLHLLMLDCWQRDRSQRPRFEQIVSSLDRMIRNPNCLKTVGVSSSRSTQPLLSNCPPDFPALSTPHEWLEAIKMERYKENFDKAGYTSLEVISRLTAEDIQMMGVTLSGHQKKMMSNIQLLKAHLQPLEPVEV
ncbi:ephrin type-B receptor 5-like [Bombina bombina]|uniref:ephrin type-B receptor 5-like n=1 Tax=Bombina bombina TaxID=8345 RepID=UPI00235A846E|nr:ephrin type-B receptor 5-like [Bombina bombina]